MPPAQTAGSIPQTTLPKRPSGFRPASFARKTWAMALIVILELFRRKDFYVLFILTALLTGIMASVNFFNEQGILRYVKEICLLLIWISSLVIAITTAARQIPVERESRTLFPLLAKPVTRTEVVIGKFLGCWLASGLVLLVFYLFFGVMAMSREGAWPLVNYFQALWLHWVMLGIIISMTLAGSLVFTAPSSTVTIVFAFVVFVLLLGRHLNKVALQMQEPSATLLQIIYFTIPHLEFFDWRDLIIHNWPAVKWRSWALATLYGWAYTLFFLICGCLFFRWKRVV
jgi:Cu-processing system permease protein